MGRKPRPVHAGLYHVAGHSSDTRRLFLVDEDRHQFLAELESACERFELGVVSYVLMSSHYHALLRVDEGLLPSALQRLHTRYARAHNRRHGRSAHLFRAHSYVGEIESSEQLVTASRYLARNPVEVGLAPDPFAWTWASAGAHAGLGESSVPLLEEDLAGAFGEGRDWRSRYREYVQS